MNNHLIITLVLLALCAIAFMRNKPRSDIVAICAFLLLPAFGIISFDDCLKSFSDSSVVIIALMFVISSAITRTGISYKVGSWIVRKSRGSESRLVVLLMLSTAIVGSCMSTTAVIAIFIPITLRVAQSMKISPSKLMMPLGFAAIISGMATLVATSPNLIMNGLLIREGYDGFRFFDITPIGIVVLICGTVYMFYARRFLGGEKDDSKKKHSRRSLSDFVRDYELSDRQKIFIVDENSQLVGSTLGDLKIYAEYGANILCIERRRRMERILLEPTANTRIYPCDILLVDMSKDISVAEQMAQDLNLKNMSLHSGYFEDYSLEVGMVEITILPGSSLISKTIIDSHFRTVHRLNAVGLRRNAEALQGDILTTPLKVGDIILLIGSWKSVRVLKEEHKDFIILNMPVEYDTAAAAPGKAPYALFSLGVMIMLMIIDGFPNAFAVFIACMLMIIFKCIDIEKAYSSIYWPALMVIIGMMPFAIALERTGAISMAANFLVDNLGAYGPRCVMAGLFLITVLTGLFLANTVTAILIAPLAITSAVAMNASPYPFAMTVAIACSTAFMTPLSSPVNMLVLGPGRYKFSDFFKIGVPFSIIVMLISVIMIPWLFPF